MLCDYWANSVDGSMHHYCKMWYGRHPGECVTMKCIIPMVASPNIIIDRLSSFIKSIETAVQEYNTETWY